MRDYEGDEDTIVVNTESDMNSRRKKLPQSRSPESTKLRQSVSKIPQESSSSRSILATREPKSDRLFKSSQHKEWAHEFIWRYMHRNELYSQHLTDNDVMDLVQEIDKHTGMSATDGLHRVVCADLKAFISSWTNRWHSDGLLIECWHPDGLTYRRTPNFDVLLKSGSNPYSLKNAARHASLPSEMVITEEHFQSGLQKRVRQTVEDIPSQKRRKGDAGQAIKNERASPKTANRLQTPPGSALGDDDGHIGSPSTRRECDASDPASPPPTTSGWVAINDPVSSIPSDDQNGSEITTTTTSEVHDEPRESEHKSQSGLSMDTAPLDAPLCRAMSQPAPSSFLATSSPTTGSTPAPSPFPSRIFFIPQKRNLFLDFARPLPSLRDLTVAEFFALFATRKLILSLNSTLLHSMSYLQDARNLC
ncbi:hypothetical protein BKA64DRAFT_647354 [Cadophora sp. MPI-SDFR-AT-0126]|nr:hypothetical protein BKA64DRAFT_647354 [Leotiomycetes sp. MPI-SDFR-AT-0126]